MDFVSGANKIRRTLPSTTFYCKNMNIAKRNKKILRNSSLPFAFFAPTPKFLSEKTKNPLRARRRRTSWEKFRLASNSCKHENSSLIEPQRAPAQRKLGGIVKVIYEWFFPLFEYFIRRLRTRGSNAGEDGSVAIAIRRGNEKNSNLARLIYRKRRLFQPSSLKRMFSISVTFEIKKSLQY